MSPNKKSIGVGMQLNTQNSGPDTHLPGTLDNPYAVVLAYSPITWNEAAGGSGVQGHPQLHSEFQVRNQSQKVGEGTSLVECSRRMGKALGLILSTTKERGKKVGMVEGTGTQCRKQKG